MLNSKLYLFVLTVIIIIIVITIDRTNIFLLHPTKSSDSSVLLINHTELYKGGLRGWPLETINGEEYFPCYKTDLPLIAVIDTGIDINNPYLLTENIYETILDDNNSETKSLHGTMVAGLIIARGNGKSTPEGMLPNAKLISIQIGSDMGTNSTMLAKAIITATDKGAALINISMGTSLPSQILEDAVKYSLSKGVVIVAAAGHNDENLLYPAAYGNVIAVSALSHNQRTLNDIGTNYKKDSIFSPGDNILTTCPSNLTDNYMYWFSGSSAASPLVTSVVAIMLSKKNYLSADQVNRIIHDTAKIVVVDGKQIKILDARAAINCVG